MLKYERQELVCAAGCLLCVAVAAKFQFDLDGSEFSGGRVTGRLLTMNFAGLVVFVLALCVVFRHSRAAAVSALVASALCLPLYLYFTVPRLFRRVFPGEYSVPAQAFGWDLWSIAGILSTVLIVWLCYRSFRLQSSRR